MRSYLDNIFGYLAGDTLWNEDTDGHVESPTGFIALVEFPEDRSEREKMIRELESLSNTYAEDYEDEDTVIEPGWYIVQEDSDGFIHWDIQTSEKTARNQFKDLQDEYYDWLSNVPNPSDYFDR